jgi:hypothetical protein
MTEHQKSELLFNFKKFGAIEITGVDMETGTQEEYREFGVGNNEDEVLQFITDLENAGLTILF